MVPGDDPRFSFSDGVNCPRASVNSPTSTVNRRIDSARDTSRFASSTARWMSARSSSSRTSSLDGTPVFFRICRQCASPSGSSVMSATTYGRLSPITMHWPTSGCARSQSSSGAGATFLPPDVMIRSFFRPVIVRYPSPSSSPMSPVASQPPAPTPP